MRRAGARVIRGPARPGRKTKNLTPLLKRGDIAVVDHSDMDGVCAQGLVERRIAAVVNASESLTGRYPASGPGVLLDAGIPIYDCAGAALFDRLAPGATLEILTDGSLFQGDEKVAAARPLTPEVLEAALVAARAGIAERMQEFVQNTLSYLVQEWPLLFDDHPLPDLRTRMNGRPALIVVRGESYREDLLAIRSYIRDVRPVLIGVDGGADALLEMGLRPDIILGDMDSVSDATLACGAEIVVHGYERRPDAAGNAERLAPGLPRVQKLGIPAQVLYAVGMSEDVAMILAERLGAAPIVMVGSHFSLQELLDKGRKGMSSTFLARLRVGAKLVDAKGVSHLYRRGLRLRDLAWMLGAALVLVIVILSVSSSARAFVELIAVRLQMWLRHL